MYSDELEMVQSRRAFDKAQSLVSGVPELFESKTYSCSWYGTSVDAERGCFAIVKDTSELYGSVNDPLSGVIGDFIKVECNNRSVLVYVIGSSSTITTDIALTRRAYLELELLPNTPIDVYVSVVK